MADDKSQKTEKPTGRRKVEARKQGQVARSAEVAIAVSLLGSSVLLRMFLPGIVHTFFDNTRAVLASSDQGFAAPGLKDHAVAMLVAGTVPFAAVGVLLAVVTGAAQVGLRVTPSLAKPKLSRLNPKQGLMRLKPMAASWELVKNVGKLGMLVAVAWGPVMGWWHRIDEPRGLDAWLSSTVALSATVLLRAGFLAFLIAGADYGRNLVKHRRELRMTRQEVKEEAKSSEGSPEIKGKRRQLARELSRNRMLKDVARADVVIVNPTHVAVALRYEPGDVAPRVVAKGVNSLALKIRKIAYRNGVLVRQDVALARTLYRTTKVGHIIPSALYEAVAVVIAAAYRSRGRRAA